MENEKHISMEIINPCVAGIDIGSRSHFVAIGQGEKDVREFGVYNENLKAISNWLKESQIKTVAMESTGTYWQSLYAILLSDGFQVILCNGKFTKNIKGKKTTSKIVNGFKNCIVLDCYPEAFCPIYKLNNFALIAVTEAI
jgi:transposase